MGCVDCSGSFVCFRLLRLFGDVDCRSCLGCVDCFGEEDRWASATSTLHGSPRQARAADLSRPPRNLVSKPFKRNDAPTHPPQPTSKELARAVAEGHAASGAVSFCRGRPPSDARGVGEGPGKRPTKNRARVAVEDALINSDAPMRSAAAAPAKPSQRNWHARSDAEDVSTGPQPLAVPRRLAT